MKCRNRIYRFICKKLALLILLTLIMSMYGFQSIVQAATTYNFYVNSNEWWQDSNPNDGICQEGNNKNCTFLAAMQEASTKNVGDVVNITFENGLVYPIQGYLPEIKKATVNIYGNNGTIDIKGHLGYVFSFHDQSKLNMESLTIKNGSRNPLSIGNGIQVTISECTFLDNTYDGIAASGGAINNKGELTILNSTFTNNQARHGGAIYNTGSLEVINSHFNNNVAEVYGGAISSINGDAIISISTFKTNQAGELGGAINHSGNQLRIVNSIFENNKVDQDGGAVSIFLNESAKFHEIKNSTFKSNLASNKGGSIYTWQTSLALSDNTYEDNEANNGGALYFYNNGNTSLENETFTENTSQLEGGAIFLENNWVGVTISKSDFDGNSAQSGGGISIKDSKVEIESSVYRENLSVGTESIHGGGGALISNNSSSRLVEINNTTFSGNGASTHGGGIFVINRGVTNLNNVTITKNIANQNKSNSGVGGGLRVNNTNGAIVNIQNSILAENTSHAPDPTPILFLYHHDWEGTLNSKGYNILGSKGFNSKLSGTDTGNFVGSVTFPIDPLLGTLQAFDYFGETLTYAHIPTKESLAVNRGNPAGCKNSVDINLLYDQRGREPFPRILQSRCDIGAIETNFTPIPALQQLSLDANAVIGGTSVIGTIQLDVEAPEGGTVVNISSNRNFVTLPAATVTVPAGQQSATFPIQTSTANNDFATITAELNGIRKTTNLYVNDSLQEPTLQQLSLSPNEIIGGLDLIATIRLDIPAPTGGLGVNISSNKDFVQLPATTVIIPAGQISQEFLIHTSVVLTGDIATITAELNGISKTATLTVTENLINPTFRQLSLSTNEVTGGTDVTGTIILDVPAPQGGAAVNISSNKDFVTIPTATVIIPAGKTSIDFPVKTSYVSSGSYATITAELDGETISTYLYVKEGSLVFLPLVVR